MIGGSSRSWAQLPVRALLLPVCGRDSRVVTEVPGCTSHAELTFKCLQEVGGGAVGLVFERAAAPCAEHQCVERSAGEEAQRSRYVEFSSIVTTKHRNIRRVDRAVDESHVKGARAAEHFFLSARATEKISIRLA